jgi:acyl carrier protein
MVGGLTVVEVTADRPSEVLETVVGMIVGLLGEYAEEGLSIGRDTTFHDDLELESVDLVTLADLLMERYGPQVNLAEYFAEKDLDEVIAMTVGEVTDYVEQRRALAAGAQG